MLRFASKEVKEDLKAIGQSSLLSLKQKNRQRYRQTLNFMKEWTNDLMQRQNDLQKSRQELAQRVQMQNVIGTASSRFDVQTLIKEQFLKKMEDIYSKQMLVSNIEETERTQSVIKKSIEDSLNAQNNNNTFSQHDFLSRDYAPQSDRY